MDLRMRTLFEKMVEFDRGDAALIQHFTKVYFYSVWIADGEGVSGLERECLEAAAIVHDIAIPLCREKYGSDSGSYQQIEGPALARALLADDFSEAVAERVCELVAHHHTYTNIVGMDYQILVEADFLVNAYESCHSEQARRQTLQNIFRTSTGKKLYQTMYP